MDSQMPDGANLRESRLERESLALTIKCGRPGRSMPAFDKFAYSDGRCYGMKQADLDKRQMALPDPPATLQPREIELVDRTGACRPSTSSPPAMAVATA